MDMMNLDEKVVQAEEIFIEAIEVLNNSINEFIKNMDIFQQSVNENKIENAQNVFHDMIIGLENFLPLVILLKSNLKEYNVFNEMIKDFNDFEVNLLENLKKILIARENNDLILLCDLLQYEMKDSLVSWQKETLQALNLNILAFNER